MKVGRISEASVVGFGWLCLVQRFWLWSVLATGGSWRLGWGVALSVVWEVHVGVFLL